MNKILFYFVYNVTSSRISLTLYFYKICRSLSFSRFFLKALSWLVLNQYTHLKQQATVVNPVVVDDYHMCFHFKLPILTDLEKDYVH